MEIEVGIHSCNLRSKLWLKQKEVKRKVSGKHAAAVINIVAAAVPTAGKKITRQLDEVSDISFIWSLRSFNTSFLY
jgi:hypothetical protein